MTDPRPHPPRLRPGFTLQEILIVIGIIVVVLAIAVPSFRYFTDAGSREGALNVASALISQARATALARGELIGVAVFNRPGSGASVALVERKPLRTWNATTIYNPGEYVQLGTNLYVALIQNQNTNPNSPVSPPRWRQLDLTGITTPLSDLNILDIIPETDILNFPSRVHAWTINDGRLFGTLRENFNPVGVILFDATGRLVTRPYLLLPDSQIMQRSNIRDAGGNVAGWPTGPGNAPDFVRSAVGLAVFDRDVFTTQFSDTFNVSATPSVADRDAINTFMAQNALPVLVNRYNGTLVRGSR